MAIYQNKTQSIKIFVDMLNQNLLTFVRQCYFPFSYNIFLQVKRERIKQTVSEYDYLRKASIWKRKICSKNYFEIKLEMSVNLVTVNHTKLKVAYWIKKDENAHRFAISLMQGELLGREKERDREKARERKR